MSEAAAEKRMRLRYAGVCRLCETELPARSVAIYERPTKTVRCLTCSPTTTPALSPEAPPERATGPDTAGGSARREYERRRAERETGVRERHPRLGGLILALTHEPQSTTAWQTGAIGEERLGKRLDDLASPTVRVLHDRRVPGSRANIDHVAVTSTGVFVIDAKRYRGKRPALRIEGGILRPRVEKLMVGGRDRTTLVDGVLKQVDVVRSLVGDDVRVTGVLCFVEADWPFIGGSFTTRGVDVLWPTKLCSRLTAAGPDTSLVDQLHRRLATALVPA